MPIAPGSGRCSPYEDASKPEFAVRKRARFTFEQHGNPVSHGVRQSRAAGGELLLFPIVFEWPLSHRADEQFK